LIIFLYNYIIPNNSNGINLTYNNILGELKLGNKNLKKASKIYGLISSLNLII